MAWQSQSWRFANGMRALAQIPHRAQSLDYRRGLDIFRDFYRVFGPGARARLVQKRPPCFTGIWAQISVVAGYC